VLFQRIVWLSTTTPPHDAHAMSRPIYRANHELALHVADSEAAAALYERELGGRVANRTPDCIEIASGALRLFEGA
jgi:hypothetical protein